MTAAGSKAVSRSRRCFVCVQVLLFSLTLTIPLQTSSAWAPPLSAASPRFARSSSTRLSASAPSLSSLTVKELRQLVKESTDERGVLSRLKKKQDLVDYLQEQPQSVEPVPVQTTKRTSDTTPDVDQEEKIVDVSNPKEIAAPPVKDRRPVNTESSGRKAPLRMPPLPLERNVNGATVDADKEEISPAAVRIHASPKDAIFEKVYALYPSLRDGPVTNSSASPLDDVRQLHHPIFQGNNVSSDMDVVFIGTASCTPGMTRGVSCTALRLNWQRRAAFLNPDTGKPEQVSNFQGGTWLFDVGECTQLQVQRSVSVKPSKITKIFVTHAHGDHSFGIPGLLCLMGQDRDRENSPPIDIYGPEGLRMWLRVAVRYSVSRIVPAYRVHEIMDVPMAPEWEFNPRTRRFFYRGRKNLNGNTARWGTKGLAGEDPTNWISQANMLQLKPSPLYGEIEGGRSVYPVYGHALSADGAPIWEVEDEGDVKVYAAPMSHGIPCVGYTVEELERPGRLRNELVEPIVIRNSAALKEAGFRAPMKAMAVIKNLLPGTSFTFPDGTVVAQEEAVEAPRQGRKVVICGDTADSRAMSVLAKDADLVIHEATNSYLAGLDKDTNARTVQRDAVVHGHSTPTLAGEFAKRVNAKRLVLNHFSARYKGDVSVDSLSIMMRIEMQAMHAAGLNKTQIATAWDLMVLPIPQTS